MDFLKIAKQCKRQLFLCSEMKNLQSISTEQPSKKLGRYHSKCLIFQVEIIPDSRWYIILYDPLTRSGLFDSLKSHLFEYDGLIILPLLCFRFTVREMEYIELVRVKQLALYRQVMERFKNRLHPHLCAIEKTRQWNVPQKNIYHKMDPLF